MTEARDDGRSGPAQEPVGSLVEEAAKLLEALREQSHQQASGAGGFADGVSALWRDLNEHLANGENCRYCPVCQLIGVLREPEVRSHLTSAAGSLTAALASALATRVPDQQPPGTTSQKSADDEEA